MTRRRKAATLMAIVVLISACSAGPTATTSMPSTSATTVGAVASASVPSTASKGCGTSTAVAGTTRETMTVSGLDRSWVLRVPAAHDGRTPLPLVLQFHGYGSGAADMAETGLDAFGDSDGFVVATPVGRGAKPRWLFELDTPALDVTTANPDIAFVGALIDRLGRELCLDTSRVFATGLSNGAWLTSALPCALGDRIAAVAPVAGVVDFGAACHPVRPVPVIALHGSADPVLPMAGGFDPGVLAELEADTRGTFGGDDPIWAVPVRDRVTGLAVRNGCQREPRSDRISGDADRLTWTCPARADVQLVVVDGGGHVWPRGEAAPSDQPGATPQMVDASRLIWEFFTEHPLGPTQR